MKIRAKNNLPKRTTAPVLTDGTDKACDRGEKVEVLADMKFSSNGGLVNSRLSDWLDKQDFILVTINNYHFFTYQEL